MADQDYLTIGEFSRWATKIDQQLTGIATEQQEQAKIIAVLADRARSERKAARNRGSLWGALGGFVGGLISGIMARGGQ